MGDAQTESNDAQTESSDAQTSSSEIGDNQGSQTNSQAQDQAPWMKADGT